MLYRMFLAIVWEVPQDGLNYVTLKTSDFFIVKVKYFFYLENISNNSNKTINE